MASPTLDASAASGLAERRYSRAAMVLHWLISAVIVTQLALGWIMNEVLKDHSPSQEQVEGIHISLGLTLILLVVVRIAIRLTHRPPSLPAGMQASEKALAHGTHLALYVLMLAIPLTGWALVSLGSQPISFWGLPWPHLPGVAELFGPSPAKAARQQLKHIHIFILIWAFVVAWALHVTGAFKHQFDGRPVLWRMIPFLRPRA